jgi:hypothetical protein
MTAEILPKDEVVPTFRVTVKNVATGKTITKTFCNATPKDGIRKIGSALGDTEWANLRVDPTSN